MKTETVIIISTAAALVVAFIATAVGAIRKSTANPEPEKKKRPLIVKLPIDAKVKDGYAFTYGKEYVVKKQKPHWDTEKYGMAFEIEDDGRYKWICSEYKDDAIGGLDWVVVKYEGDPEPATITAKIDTAKPRPPKVVRAPEGCEEYLTAGKNYTVTSVGVYIEGDGYEFYTIDDIGDEIGCHEKESIHLNGGDWIIVEREGDGGKQPSIAQQLFEAQSEATRLAGELEVVKDQRDNAIEERDMFNQAWEKAEQQRDEARIECELLEMEIDKANEYIKWMRERLAKAESVIKDLEDVNGQLLAMVQGEDEQPEVKPTTEPAIDWTKPVAFPNWYEVPEGTRVVAIKNRPTGIKELWSGIIEKTEYDVSPMFPFVRWHLKGFNNGFPCAIEKHCLAPLDPADHPLHPEFKGNKTKNK